MKTKMVPVLVSTFLILVIAVSLSAAGERGDKTPGRERAFRAGLEANGFIVKSGTSYPVDTISDLLDSGLGDTANANNPGQPYKVLAIPPHPTDKDLPADLSELALSFFRLRPDEAIVYVGPTPPLADYFSFTPYLWVRREGRIVTKGDFIFAAVNDPLNSAGIKTEGNGNPFHKQTVIIFTADQGVYARVAALARAAGYPDSMINSCVFPSELLHMGVFFEYRQSDSFVLVVRTANFVSKAEGHHYLNNSSYAAVWRVTPEVNPALNPFPTPVPRQHKWISEKTLFPDLENGLKRLEQAILEQIPHVESKSFETMRWWPASREVLEAEADPQSPNYHKFIAGEASDTPYLRTANDGKPANFILGENDLVVVYGVNHAATGLATYSSLGIYGDWITSSCDTIKSQFEYVFGCGDHIWNGVTGMNSHEFKGSAEQYIPGDPMAPYLYAVKVMRQPAPDKHARFWVRVPEPPCEMPPCEEPLPSYNHGIALDKPICIGHRAYLNPATGAGPDYDDIIWDKAIWFKLKAKR